MKALARKVRPETSFKEINEMAYYFVSSRVISGNKNFIAEVSQFY